MSEFILPTIFSLFILSGVFLALIPFFPALSYMLVLALVFAFVDNFVRISYLQLSFLVLITLISICVDWIAGVLGARYGGAHKKSIIFGIGGMIVGTLLVPPFGGVVCLFLVIFVVEMLMQKKSERQSLRAASGAFLGTIAGMGMNVLLATIFFTLFSFFVFF